MRFDSARISCVVALCLAVAAAGRPAHGQCESRFRRGDYDLDSYTRLSDVVQVFSFLFRNGQPPPCADAADDNDDGRVDISDGIYLLGFLFLGRAAPPSPFVSCGTDPTPDQLDCERYPGCSMEVFDEICDGEDNDCDGEIDEDFDKASDLHNCGECGRSCPDLSWPNVASYACAGGACAIESCEPGFVDDDGIAENGCEFHQPFVPCDDGNPCTTNDVIIGGLCGGTPVICSHLDDYCGRGVCDGETGECVKVPQRLYYPCDDGNPQTVADRCTQRAECEGIPFP